MKKLLALFFIANLIFLPITARPANALSTPTITNMVSQKISSGKTISVTANANDTIFAFISKGGGDTPSATSNGIAMLPMLTNNTQGRHQTVFMGSATLSGSYSIVFSTTQSQGTITAFTVGGDNAVPIGQNSTTQTNTSTTIADSVTLTFVNSMVVMCTFVDNAPTITTNSGQTNISKVADGTSQSGACSYRVPLVSGTIPMGYTLSAPSDWEPITFEILATVPSTGGSTMNTIFYDF